jgi:hypothetical protein
MDDEFMSEQHIITFFDSIGGVDAEFEEWVLALREKLEERGVSGLDASQVIAAALSILSLPEAAVAQRRSLVVAIKKLADFFCEQEKMRALKEW